MIILRRSAAILLGLLAPLLPLTLAPAYADETTPTEPPKVELVLDVSGSMRADDLSGRTRIAVAQDAFNEVVDALPEQTELGIRVLGATYAGNDKAIGCKDTQQIVAVGPVDRVKAKNAIATLRPTGFTPVGLALRAAAQDLGTGGTARRIILITDGEDTCAPPDPCEVARELAAAGTPLIIDTLGLALDEKVRKQLVCIAAATGGSYTAAQSKEELSGRIQQLVDRAKDTYTRTPTVVTGADSCVNAPSLSAGIYTDRERFEEHRWYRVMVRTGEELRVSVSVSLDRPVARDYGVLLRAVAPDGRELVRGTDAGSGRTDVLSTGVRWSASDAASDAAYVIAASPTTTGTVSSSASVRRVAPSTTPPVRASATASAGAQEASVVCLVVSNSFAAAKSGNATNVGMPVELTVDLVAASPSPNSPGLGQGWVLLGLLTVAGLLTGLVGGVLTRFWIAVWRRS